MAYSSFGYWNKHWGRNQLSEGGVSEIGIGRYRAEMRVSRPESLKLDTKQPLIGKSSSGNAQKYKKMEE